MGTSPMLGPMRVSLVCCASPNHHRPRNSDTSRQQKGGPPEGKASRTRIKMILRTLMNSIAISCSPRTDHQSLWQAIPVLKPHQLLGKERRRLWSSLKGFKHSCELGGKAGKTRSLNLQKCRVKGAVLIHFLSCLGNTPWTREGRAVTTKNRILM